MITAPCNHCWHRFFGVLHMVVPQGRIVQECCKCSQTRVVHSDHAHDDCKMTLW